MIKKRNLIFLNFSFHLIGIASSLFRLKKDNSPHHPFQLFCFFSWWSVHTSILTILSIVLIWSERKKTCSYFSQFLNFISTLYNLVTFCFISGYFLTGKIKSYGFWLDLQLFSWHFVAPFLTILNFYFYSRIDKLREKLTKTLLFIFICPAFYFFYTFSLSKIHNDNPKSSLFPYIKKYPYFIFEWIVERKWIWIISNLLITSFVIISLCLLMIWTKMIWDKNKNWRKK
jgi:hypothetical protein